jgi:anaerobic magnesium-protoporphyrin IX monomethyl ester cyclase
MTLVLVNPNLVFQGNDPFTTGIVYMPVGLAYTAAGLRAAGHKVRVVDAFAERPRQARQMGHFHRLGLTDAEVLDRFPADTEMVFVYAINLTSHIATIGVVRAIKGRFPEVPVVILENTQAVTAYALEQVANEFFRAGADYILSGEGDRRAIALADAILAGDKKKTHTLDGLAWPDNFQSPQGFIPGDELDELPWPAWDLFPLQNYWDLRFAHGPQSTSRYLPLLTSRGCPYPCRFCVVPATNRQKWRARSAENVVDEIEHYLNEFQVREFHIEDLDPTISDERIRAICKEIVRRGLKVVWKIAAGTKVETIRDEQTIDLMAAAGCRYISISPETGSPDLLKKMKKPFDLEHAIRLTGRMNQVGIYSQACFVLGFPGETEEDRKMTRNMVRELTRRGVDEIALFIITPVPGSAIYDQFGGYGSFSDLNFSPTWRDDYQDLSRFRLKLYASFLWWKLRFHPLKFLRHPVNFLRRRFETKMEMVPYRALSLARFARKSIPEESHHG